MHKIIRIPMDSISHHLVGAGGFAHVIVAGVTYEIFASGDLNRIIHKARTRVHGGARVQPAQPKKDLR